MSGIAKHLRVPDDGKRNSYRYSISRYTADWPCGHPRTPGNTQSIGKAGVRCRLCRRRISREHNARRTASQTIILDHTAAPIIAPMRGDNIITFPNRSGRLSSLCQPDTAERTPTKQPLGPCIEKLPEPSCPTSSSAGGTVQTPEKPAAVPHLITARTLCISRQDYHLRTA